MSDLATACRVVLNQADPRGVPVALIGGFAVSVRTEPRFTRDVDIVVAVDDDPAAEEFLRALLADGHELLATVEQEVAGRLATARLRLVEGPSVDLLFASSGIEGEVAAAAEELEVLPGLTIAVATVAHLIALKILARDDVTRPQDIADLRRLVALADSDDIDEARSSLELIAERGFHRDRDLLGHLDRLCRDAESSGS